MGTFGLPWLTFLFVFGGFFTAVAGSLAFAVWFKPKTDNWFTLEDLLSRRGHHTADR